jgi:putative ABC transport system permease protein
MNILEEVNSVWRIVGRNKVRSFLTMLGIVIGIMSVIVVMSVGAGAQSLILNQVTSLGSNLIGILPGKSEDNGPPASAMGIVVTTLKQADIKALTDSDYSNIVAAHPMLKGLIQLVGKKVKPIQILWAYHISCLTLRIQK